MSEKDVKPVSDWELIGLVLTIFLGIAVAMLFLAQILTMNDMASEQNTYNNSGPTITCGEAMYQVKPPDYGFSHCDKDGKAVFIAGGDLLTVNLTASRTGNMVTVKAEGSSLASDQTIPVEARCTIEGTNTGSFWVWFSGGTDSAQFQINGDKTINASCFFSNPEDLNGDCAYNDNCNNPVTVTASLKVAYPVSEVKP